MTVINIDIPNIKAKEDKIVEVENALSFFELKIYDKESLRKIFLKIKFLQII